LTYSQNRREIMARPGLFLDNCAPTGANPRAHSPSPIEGIGGTTPLGKAESDLVAASGRHRGRRTVDSVAGRSAAARVSPLHSYILGDAGWTGRHETLHTTRSAHWPPPDGRIGENTPDLCMEDKHIIQRLEQAAWDAGMHQAIPLGTSRGNTGHSHQSAIGVVAQRKGYGSPASM
jgi:hypothetical protein